MTGVSIVVPVYNALEDARKCVESIYASRTAVEFEVIVVDNGSRSEVAEWLLAERARNFRWLRFEEPLGFARAMNEGARLARFDFLALLNSDTLVTDGWLDILAGELEKDAELGIVSPVTNRCGHDAQRDPAARQLAPEDAGRYAASMRDRGPSMPEAQRLAFFCVLVRRTLWEELDGLDEAFQAGNFEDDDFCLRARMAGYRMSVAPNAFVFHSERRTFDANRLNHGEWLAGNRALFGARASRWSRTLRSAIPGARPAASISVIVPVLADRADGVRDSLASLANQTVKDFETVVVSAKELDLCEFSSRLRLKIVSAEEQGAAAQLNAGLAAASGAQIAYLPSGDIYYPFHLETLANALPDVDAVFSAWSVAISERRASVIFPDAEPGIELGDWAPLLCWLHRRSALRFDPSFGVFSPWAYLLRLRDSVKSRYLCRVTCERRPEPPTTSDAADAERVMTRFPVETAWQHSQREQFLAGVQRGNWEDRLIISNRDKARRAREMLRRAAVQGMAQLRAKLHERAAAIEPQWRDKPDIFLFSIIEWTALTQRPHHFAEGLAARGHRVFWVDVRLRPAAGVDAANLARELKPGLYHLELPAGPGEVYRLEWSPELLEAMEECFAYLRAAFGISSAWQLVNFPRWEPLVTRLRVRFAWPVAYDCLDDQRAFAALYGHDLGQSETILFATSSRVFVSGQTLLERQPNALLIPNAADFELFHNARPAGLLDHLARPIVGFFGAFANWLDFDWMDAAASRFPAWSFVYIGREGFVTAAARERWKNLANRPNVHVFPQAEPEKLARFLAQMDVCTMPFQDVPVARSMNAVKIYEYLAAGKPVVAAHLPETVPLSDAGLIATYRTHQESFRLLEEAMRMGPERVAARVEFASKNTWRHRVEQLAAALGL